MPDTARILLVDDDPEQMLLFSQVLKMSGYAVTGAADAEGAMGLVKAQENFDLALVDWDLPGMKGDAFLAQLRQCFPAIRTVLFSNHADVDRAARAVGADGWIRKSEGIISLRNLIAQMLQPA